MHLTLPFPPSVNRMYRVFRGRAIISRVGRAYRAAVCEQLAGHDPIQYRCAVSIIAHPPDNRRRDLDNLLKAALDGLVHGGVLGDDSLIDLLAIARGSVKRNGELDVRIQPVDPEVTYG